MEHGGIGSFSTIGTQLGRVRRRSRLLPAGARDGRSRAGARLGRCRLRRSGSRSIRRRAAPTGSARRQAEPKPDAEILPTPARGVAGMGASGAAWETWSCSSDAITYFVDAKSHIPVHPIPALMVWVAEGDRLDQLRRESERCRGQELDDSLDRLLMAGIAEPSVPCAPSRRSCLRARPRSWPGCCCCSERGRGWDRS